MFWYSVLKFGSGSGISLESTQTSLYGWESCGQSLGAFQMQCPVLSYDLFLRLQRRLNWIYSFGLFRIVLALGRRVIRQLCTLSLVTHRFRERTYSCRGTDWGKGLVREFGMDMYTLLYFKWVINKDLLCSTGNSAECYMVAWMRGELGGEWIHVYV